MRGRPAVNARMTMASARPRVRAGSQAVRRERALADARRDRASVMPVKYTFAVTISTHIATAVIRRPPHEPAGRTMPVTSAVNSRPICDRISRYRSSCRREIGAGNRNWISGSENSKSRLSNGKTQLIAVTASSTMPAIAGPAAPSAASADCVVAGDR